MDQSYGIPSHHDPAHQPHRPRARYLVLIDGDGVSLAKLFLENREQVGEFAGGSEEVCNMTAGRVAAGSADDAAWDVGLSTHTAAERAAAQVYTLDV